MAAREQFGRKIADFQAIAFKLAETKTRIDSSRLPVGRAGGMARNNKPFTAAEGSMAKLVASETAVYVTDEPIQIPRRQRPHAWPSSACTGTRRSSPSFEGTSGNQRLVAAIGNYVTGQACSQRARNCIVPSSE